MENNENWNEVLAQFQKSYAEAKPFDKFDPADGTYTCYISDLKTGKSKKTGQPYWAIQGTLVDGTSETGDSLTGQTFDLAFFSPKMFGMFKSFALKLNDGIEPSTLVELESVVKNSIASKLLTINVTHREYQGTMRTNIEILDVAPMADGTIDKVNEVTQTPFN